MLQGMSAMASGCSTLCGRPGLLLACATVLVSLSISPARGRVMLTGAGEAGPKLRAPCPLGKTIDFAFQLQPCKSMQAGLAPQPSAPSAHASSPTPCTAERFQVGFRDLKPYVDEGYGHRYYYQVPPNPRGTVIFIHAVSGASPKGRKHSSRGCCVA